MTDLTDSAMAGGIQGIANQPGGDSTPVALRTAGGPREIDADALDEKIKAFREKHKKN